MPNSSKIVGFDATIPTSASTGNHSIFASINATRNANAYSETTFTEIAVRSPSKFDFAANRLGCCMDLFLVYPIPGVVLKVIYLSLK